MTDPPVQVCEVCAVGQVEKLLFPVAVHFKGKGFYSTDYGRARAGTSKEGESTSSKEGESVSKKEPSSGDAGSKKDSTGDSGTSSSSKSD